MIPAAEAHSRPGAAVPAQAAALQIVGLAAVAVKLRVVALSMVHPGRFASADPDPVGFFALRLALEGPEDRSPNFRCQKLKKALS